MRRGEAHARVMETLRLGEQDDAWIEQHREALEACRGEWVVSHSGRVEAHAHDGREVVRLADARHYPVSTPVRMPALGEGDTVHIP